MNEKILRWNERYAAGEGLHDFAPAPLVVEAAALAKPGLALDVACGAGRNALSLAERGWRVRAVDGSDVAIDILASEARRRGLVDRIEARVADLEASPRGFAFDVGTYDLVLDIHFLDRSLFDELRDAVRPGGLFAAAIHIEDSTAEKPMKPSFLLAPRELRAIVDSWGWEVLVAREGDSRESGHRRDSAEIIARRPSFDGG